MYSSLYILLDLKRNFSISRIGEYGKFIFMIILFRYYFHLRMICIIFKMSVINAHLMSELIHLQQGFDRRLLFSWLSYVPKWHGPGFEVQQKPNFSIKKNTQLIQELNFFTDVNLIGDNYLALLHNEVNLNNDKKILSICMIFNELFSVKSQSNKIDCDCIDFIPSNICFLIYTYRNQVQFD